VLFRAVGQAHKAEFGTFRIIIALNDRDNLGRPKTQESQAGGR
jgi:hypothetical protein